MFNRKFAALLFVAVFMVCSQLPAHANDFDKIMNKGLNLGKKEALKQVGRTLQKKQANATLKTSAAAAETSAKASTTSTKGAATSATASSTTKASTTSKIKAKVAAEAERNAKKYANKYLRKEAGQLTKFLK